LLAVIEQPESSAFLIHAEVAFMRDEQDTGAIMDVRVVMRVDQEMARDFLLLNPTVKYRNEITETHRLRVGHEYLDADFVKVHVESASVT
jgi:head-tail adaptor